MGYRVAHLSDCHLGPLPPVHLADLASKRILGFLNWQKNRAKSFDPAITDQLVNDLKAQAPDHIAVTGDLVNIALDYEIERAGAFLRTLGHPDMVTVIPGNHDAYVPGALERFNAACTPFLTSDGNNAAATRDPYPVFRQRGSIRLIGVSTAVATGPFMATGAISDAQRTKLATDLVASAGLFRLVLIHHPPFANATPWHKRLRRAESLRAIFKSHGCELILHGHTHLSSKAMIAGPDGKIPVFGVSSAAQAPSLNPSGGHKPAASYALYDITEAGGGWTVRMTRRGYSHDASTITDLKTETLSVPHPSQSEI
ncbi:MAG: metallophosphoesterase [Pseudomonadota bacterium]